ncbi:hypothetical protein [Actinacidiphila alni]|uniref:hypothetical protein n=1 Tax=Actinacidiphila alni TaxID=380248 RepID=UPI003452C48E
MSAASASARMYGCGTVPSPASGLEEGGEVEGMAGQLGHPGGALGVVRGEPQSVRRQSGHPLTGGARLGDLSEALWLDAPAAAVPLDDLRAAVGGGFPSAVRYAGGDARVLHELVRAGHGLALLPASAAGRGTLPLTAPHLVHRVEIARPPSPTPAAALFAELLGAPPGR